MMNSINAPSCSPGYAVALLFGVLVFGNCEAVHSMASSADVAVSEVSPVSLRAEQTQMWMIIGERRFAITLTDNAAATALRALLPLTLDMSELNGNEKYASLPEALPVHATRPGTVRNGDLMLYGTDTLVIFYETFSTSYRYTRLGRIDDSAGLAQALGRDGVQVVLSTGEASDHPATQSTP